MTNLSRRRFLTIAGTITGTTFVATVGFPLLGLGANRHIVVVGGGIGGATAAKYIRMADASIDVTLIEPKEIYHTCFMSNEVLGGGRDIKSIQFGYEGLKQHGVKVMHDSVIEIDPVIKKVTTKAGSKLYYDACIVAPGISFNWDAIEGYDAEVSKKLPHAWQAGAQTTLLKNQLRDMRDGGTVIIVAPPNPFRCPPGPYERASQIAWYLKNNKPKSKIIILDPKEKFSKMALFQAGWRRHYGYGTANSMIEWVGGLQGGEVNRVDAKKMTAVASSNYRGDVINVIPPQIAGEIAVKAGLVDEMGWCPVNHKNFESLLHKDIYVIGDAAIASPMPKSGYAANTQAKVCAVALVAKLNGKEDPVPSYVNTCYSLLTPDDGLSVAMVYKLGPNGKIVEVESAGGLTPIDASDMMRKREVSYAYSWFNNITFDTFG